MMKNKQFLLTVSKIVKMTYAKMAAQWRYHYVNHRGKDKTQQYNVQALCKKKDTVNTRH